MFGGDRDLDTICAISTPPGTGGIHLIRITGPRALSISQNFAPFLPQKIESHRVYFGTIVWGPELEPIDEVLVTYFKQGSSFTSEETLEISCHGSPFIANQIIKVALKFGARVADRGEFTYRAFLNGKVDLIQAESVLSLIESESEKSSQIALSQLKGGLSSKLKQMESDIVALLARLEVSIDFTTEDIEIINNSEIQTRLTAIQEPLLALLKSYKVGRKIQSGFEVLLVGEPNVGKSSLLNRVLSEERAIVTDIAGTTRDLIQEQIIIKGVKVSLIDSAGMRETTDIIEQIGVKKTKVALANADLILALFDCSNPRLEYLIPQLSTEDFSKVVFIGNKADLILEDQKNQIKASLQRLLKVSNLFPNSEDIDKFLQQNCFFTSAISEVSKNGKDLDVQEQILGLIGNHLHTGSFGDESILSQTRHFENLQRAAECFERSSLLAKAQQSPEFLALEVKEALIRVQEVLGERFDDQILDRVFKEFCIGK